MPTCHALARPYAPRHWSRLPFAAALVAVALVGGTLGFTRAAQAATIPVNTTTDEFNTGPNCSLRDAIQAANTDTAVGGCTAGSGADTITLPSGTFQITLNPGSDENANAAGDFDIASSLTSQGAGAGSTIVDGRGLDRVFDVAPNGGPAITVGFSGLTVQNGKGLSTNFGAGGGMFINSNATVSISNSTLANNQSTTTVGGAIANRGTLTLNTVTMQNNTALALGGAIHSAASGGGGGLTVINSTFTGNKAESGGVLYISTDTGTNASITGSTFSNNQAVATSGGAGDDGGAIAIDTDGAVNITKSIFTGNSAAANGGAIYFNDSATQAAVAALTLSYNRIVGNTAAAGSGLFHASGTATAERNWWGCNSGPAAAPCNVAAGNADVTPWIVLTHTADPTTIGTGQAATLTAGFLKNSDGSTNIAGDLGAFGGVPISFGAVLGTISGAQTTIQANGEATATYTAGSTPGAGSATATVDSATVTANLTLIQSDTTPPDTTITASPSNPSNDTSPSFGFAGSDDQTPAGSLTFECALGNSAFAACPNPQTYSSLADGSYTFQVRAVDAAGNVDPSPASYTWTIDATPPSVTINQASGQADPTTAGPIHFTVVFNEPVTGFGDSAGDVTLGGTAGATTAAVTEIAPNNGTTYDVAVSGMTVDGTVIAAVGAGAATDAVGNASTASTSTDNIVTFIANQAPTAVADSYSTNEDTPLNVAAPGVLGNDSDPDTGDTLSAVLVSGPSHAAAFTLNADGSFGYTPAANYNGPDSFSYKARDAKGAESAPVTVSITVNAVNDPPTAAADSYSTNEDTPLNIAAPGVLANDSDPDTGDTLTAVLVTGPSHGILTLNADGSFGYAPAANYNGPDSFSYKARDSSNAESSPATVSITVNAVNDAPTAVADSYSTNEDTPLNVAASGVLGNDSDSDTGDTLSAVLVSGPSHGTLSLNANGSFSFTPAANYNGPDSFSYKARDSSNAESSPATVSITVNAVNDPPTIAVGTGGACSSSGVGGTINLTVVDTDSPVGGVALTASSSNTNLVPAGNIVFGGSNASRTVTVRAVPQKNSQTALITITANDGAGGTSTIQFNVIVGTDKKETINGTSFVDMIFGLNGDDTINAGDGNDLVCGGNGKGVVSGGAGDDTLDGGNGDDTLRGQAGNDILRGGAGNDRLEGGDNDDTLTGNSGADFFSGGPGADGATDFKPAEGDTQDGTLEVLSTSASSLSADPAATGSADLNPSEDISPTEDDTQAETQEPDNPGAVELTEQIYLPIVAH